MCKKENKHKIKNLTIKIYQFIKNGGLVDSQPRYGVEDIGFVINTIFFIICLLCNNNDLAQKMVLGIGIFIHILAFGVCALLIFYKQIPKQELKVSRLVLSITINTLLLISIISVIYFNLPRYITSKIWTICFSAICIWVVYYVIRETAEQEFNNELIPMLLLSMAIVSILASLILLELDNIKAAKVLVQIGVAILYLVLTTLFINAFIFMTSSDRYKFSKIMSAILFVATMVTSFPFYIEWCGVSGEHFTTFVNVYSALVGGGLTLIGVAWTIRKSDKDRRLDEIDKYKPTFWTLSETVNGMKCLNFYNTLDGFIKIVQNDQNITEWVKVENFTIQNSDKTIFFIYGFMINDDIYLVSNKFVVNKDDAIRIQAQDHRIKQLNNFCIIVEDLIGNLYKYNLRFNKEGHEKRICGCSNAESYDIGDKHE